MDLKKRLIRMIEDFPCEGPEEIGNCPYRKDGHCREMGKLDYCALSRLAEYLIESGAVAPENNPSAPAEHLPLGKGGVENDREKLIALLVDAFWASDDSYGGYPNTGQVADHLIANGVTIQRWIPVTERLPGTEKVLITNGDIVMRGYRRPDGVWKYGIKLNEVWGNLSLRPVTHWMPLPEPPIEEWNRSREGGNDG